jgi:prevent-host-death family protein
VTDVKTVTASEANRHFSSLLKEAARGERVVVTSRGKPVAELVPARRADADRERAKQRLLEHLQSVEPSGRPRDWTRDELYDD